MLSLMITSVNHLVSEYLDAAVAVTVMLYHPTLTLDEVLIVIVFAVVLATIKLGRVVEFSKT